jgi:DNA-binding MarR family transcriptional regulator
MVAQMVDNFKYFLDSSKKLIHLTYRGYTGDVSDADAEATAIATEDAVAREAWGAVFALVFSERSHERMHDACESLGLTPGLMKAMLTMRPGSGRPMKELAGQWRCDASYVTSLVDGLEERGFAERQAHPTDRRAKVVALTPLGEKTREQLLDTLHDPPPWFDALSKADRRTLRDLLRKLVAAAEAAGGDAGS